MHARGRRELARLDEEPAVRRQLRILLGLLHKARKTPFGRDHDFGRIRCEADFRRLVPLRTHAELQRLQNPPARAVGGPAHRETMRAAWRTAVALVNDARPRGRLLSGRMVFLGDGAPLGPATLPWLVRPYAILGCGAAAPDLLARTPLTCLAGAADGIAALLRRVRQFTGRERLPEIWPGLTAILYSRASPATDPGPTAGDGVLALETHFLPEGPVAVEDPRHDRPRLLCDHGVYFEFTPAEEAGAPDAARHRLAEVEPGCVYELVMTSPAGVWACRTGVAVRFERRDPPLLDFVEMPAPAPERGKVVIRPACPPQAPHRQIVGIPAGPPEKLAHSPWLAPADRG